jgi:hypothetical protein
MRKFVVVPVLTAVALLLTVSVARSSESDELRRRAQAVKKEAAELAKAGRGEEAEKLARKASELLEAAERLAGKRPKELGPEKEKSPGLLKDLIEKARRMKESGASGKELAEMQMRISKAREHLVRAGFLAGPKGPGPEKEKVHGILKDLVEKERRMKESGASEKDMDEIRQRIAEAKEEFARSGFPRRFEGPKGHGPFGPPMAGFGGPGFPRPFAGFKGPGPFGPPMPDMMAKLDETGRRIQHFRTAAENLKAAGADDLAKDLMEKAEHMEREARQSKMRLTKEGEPRPGPKMGPLPMMQFQEMRGDIGRLRAELNELRQRVNNLERGRK